MSIQKLAFLSLLFILTLVVAACARDTGTLVINANGEDFARMPFTSKDGWTIDFEHIYTTFADVTAYQTTPPYEPTTGTMPEGVHVSTMEMITSDLAVGSEPQQIATLQAVPTGHFNALSWQMVNATEGRADGNTLLMVGSAVKDGESIDFAIGIDDLYGYACGEYVGDARKGFVTVDNSAEMEITLHFDHLFGDGNAAPDESLNLSALGFAPLAALAENGQLDVTSSDLRGRLPATDYQLFEQALISLGHVGEGHCTSLPTSSRE
jgi:hypothetical protein